VDRYTEAAEAADRRALRPDAADPQRGVARMLVALGRWDAARAAPPPRSAARRGPRAHALAACAARALRR
jgi:hypothetical protein